MPIDPKPSNNLSRSFLMYPDVRFDIQRPNEQVVAIVRKHPWTQLYWMFNASLLIVLLILANFFVGNFLNPGQIIVLDMFASVFIFAYVWLNFILWYFTVGIITNQRILDLDFYNILYKEFTATTLPQVSELTTKIGGFFGSILDFGDVYVKTEGFIQDIEFDDIPQPSAIVKIVNELKVNMPDSN
ncbi:hypothetical protein BH09PAT2_BH09PAT2_03290 [soil metagenome]